MSLFTCQLGHQAAVTRFSTLTGHTQTTWPVIFRWLYRLLFGLFIKKKKINKTVMWIEVLCFFLGVYDCADSEGSKCGVEVSARPSLSPPHPPPEPAEQGCCWKHTQCPCYAISLVWGLSSAVNGGQVIAERGSQLRLTKSVHQITSFTPTGSSAARLYLLGEVYQHFITNKWRQKSKTDVDFYFWENKSELISERNSNYFSYWAQVPTSKITSHYKQITKEVLNYNLVKKRSKSFYKAEKPCSHFLFATWNNQTLILLL